MSTSPTPDNKTECTEIERKEFIESLPCAIAHFRDCPTESELTDQVSETAAETGAIDSPSVVANTDATCSEVGGAEIAAQDTPSPRLEDSPLTPELARAIKLIRSACTEKGTVEGPVSLVQVHFRLGYQAGLDLVSSLESLGVLSQAIDELNNRHFFDSIAKTYELQHESRSCSDLHD